MSASEGRLLLEDLVQEIDEKNQSSAPIKLDRLKKHLDSRSFQNASLKQSISPSKAEQLQRAVTTEIVHQDLGKWVPVIQHNRKQRVADFAKKDTSDAVSM